MVTPTTVQHGSKLTFQDNGGFPAEIAAKDFMLHGYDAFPLGGVDSACFCDWKKTTEGECEIPQNVCRYMNLTGVDCYYTLGSAEGHAFTQTLIQDWTQN